MRIWASDGDLTEAARSLRERRGLVAFPTETVYGLGANGLDADAVVKVFAVKGRPATDPVILHVLDAKQAALLQDPTNAEKSLIKKLQDAFWPGPLSIVARAAPHVPREVTAHTPFVAVRCPEHAVARRLIKEAGVPIAAPSANPFGRISPTSAEHVRKYFQHEDVDLIVSEGTCPVGIESTLVMVSSVRDSAEPKVEILRDGIISQEALVQALNGWPVSRRKERDFRALAEDETENDCPIMEGPGMFLKHYAPALPTYLLLYGHGLSVSAIQAPDAVRQSCLLDIGPAFPHAHSAFGHVILLPSKSAQDVSARLFEHLHSIEAMAVQNGCDDIYIGIHELLLDASEYKGVLDRLFRACSGKIRQLQDVSHVTDH